MTLISSRAKRRAESSSSLGMVYSFMGATRVLAATIWTQNIVVVSMRRYMYTTPACALIEASQAHMECKR